jgi:NAD(P)H-dependent flavin oxidoreductase YrpB (nitropropane dioxygenase family)
VVNFFEALAAHLPPGCTSPAILSYAHRDNATTTSLVQAARRYGFQLERLEDGSGRPLVDERVQLTGADFRVIAASGDTDTGDQLSAISETARLLGVGTRLAVCCETGHARNVQVLRLRRVVASEV